jgi:hypothetical protein
MDLVSAQEPGLSRISKEQRRRRIGEPAAGLMSEVSRRQAKIQIARAMVSGTLFARCYG